MGEIHRLVEFDCVGEPLAEGTVSVPRPPKHPRQMLPSGIDCHTKMNCFDCDVVDLPPETKSVRHAIGLWH
jgi:hypothetical protein